MFGKKSGGESGVKLSGKLIDKVVIITGGGRGIGQAVAMHCAREGARVGICARTAAEVDATVAELKDRKSTRLNSSH